MKKVLISEIKHIGYHVSSSSGTGASQWDEIRVVYTNGEVQDMMLDTWYTPTGMVLEDFFIKLKYLPPFIDAFRVKDMLFDCLVKYDPRHFITCGLSKESVGIIWRKVNRDYDEQK